MIQYITQIIIDIFNGFNSYASSNPIVAGAISLWGLTAFSYFARHIPYKIWRFTKKQSTTKLTIMSTSLAFHNFLEWYNHKGYDKRLRSFKISSGKWGTDSRAKKSIGYGKHFFIYGLRPGFISLSQQENTNSDMERDEITITIFGRDSNIYDKMFGEVKNNDITLRNKFVVYKHMGENWGRVPNQRKRKIDTIFLNKGIKKKVFNFIDLFRNNENWYLDHGLSYQCGILLYGPPGCGKTSLVKSIASYYNYSLYILPASRLHKIYDAMSGLEEHSIILIEDIDTDDITKKRKKSNKKDKNGDEDGRGFSLSNLSDILNTIDGVISNHGRLLIATTNHIEKLDAALIRAGRFDLKVKLDYADLYTLKQFINNYYPKFNIPENFKLNEKITSSDIQAAILKNLDDPKNVLKLLVK